MLRGKRRGQGYYSGGCFSRAGTPGKERPMGRGPISEFSGQYQAATLSAARSHCAAALDRLVTLPPPPLSFFRSIDFIAAASECMHAGCACTCRVQASVEVSEWLALRQGHAARAAGLGSRRWAGSLACRPEARVQTHNLTNAGRRLGRWHSPRPLTVCALVYVLCSAAPPRFGGRRPKRKVCRQRVFHQGVCVRDGGGPEGPWAGWRARGARVAFTSCVDVRGVLQNNKVKKRCGTARGLLRGPPWLRAARSRAARCVVWHGEAAMSHGRN